MGVGSLLIVGAPSIGSSRGAQGHYLTGFWGPERLARPDGPLGT